MAVSTPAGFTTIVTPLLPIITYIKDIIFALSRIVAGIYARPVRTNRIWPALQFLHDSFCSLYRAKMLHKYLSKIV